MTIRLNPAYLKAGYAFGLLGDNGKMLPCAMEWRWATAEDAQHDWERITRGLNPERTVPPLTCHPNPQPQAPDSSPPSSPSPSSPGSSSAS